MPWQPMHMAIFCLPACASPGTCWAGTGGRAAMQTTARADSVDNGLFILRAQSRRSSAPGSDQPSIIAKRLPRFLIKDTVIRSMKFQGSQNYVATQDLRLAVNAAVTLQRPLLIKGEPGTGKTMLAEEVAKPLAMPLLQWNITSPTKAKQGLYAYAPVSRLRESPLADE